MSTKYKVIVGFLFFIIVLVLTNSIGYRALNTTFKEAGESVNEAEALIYVNRASAMLRQARYDALNFVSSRNTADMNSARKAIAKAIGDMDETKRYESNQDDLRRINASIANLKNFDNLLLRLGQNVAEVNQSSNIMGEMARLSGSMLAEFDAYNISMQEHLRKLSKEMNENNSSSSRLILILSAVGIIIGILSAGWIITSIVSAMKELSRFAGQLANGEFSAPLSITEKGELGELAQSMLSIPAVLKKITAEVQLLANNIAIGHFRERFKATEYSNGFFDLGNSVNSLADAYTSILDVFPSPLMACDTNCKIVFLNKIAQQVVGGNISGVRCSEILCAKECNTPSCLGQTAIRNLAPLAGETTVHPCGNAIEAAVTAVPLFNLQGKAAGFFEVLNDISGFKNAQNTIKRVAAEASAISDQVASASEHLSAQIGQISKGADLQRARVESAVASVTQMNASALDVARNAGKASEQGKDTRNNAQAGANLVNKMVSSITEVNSVALRLQGNMAGLGQMAESIGGIMGVISDIADQTNLLALNAAIEAARAGEAGRGFAVVADEVRKLAEKTMDATKNVGANISAIQSSTHTNVADVTSAVKSIGEATELANASGAALRGIVDLVGTTSDVVAAIAAAAEEQSAASEEIAGAVNEINDIAGDSAQGMRDSSEAVRELSRMAKELRNSMEALR